MPDLCSHRRQGKRHKSPVHYNTKSARMFLPRGVPRRLGTGRLCGLGSSASAWAAAGTSRGSPSLTVVVSRPRVKLLGARCNEESVEAPVDCACGVWCGSE